MRSLSLYHRSEAQVEADRNRRKAYSGGQMYNIKREEVLDMMDRYNVNIIER